MPGSGCCSRKPERSSGVGDEIAGERAGHHDVAVGEIDQAQHAVDHGVAQRDQRIDAADRQAEHDEVEPLRGGVAALDAGCRWCRRRRRSRRRCAGPEDDVDEGESRELVQLRYRETACRRVGHCSGASTLALLKSSFQVSQPAAGDGARAMRASPTGLRPSNVTDHITARSSSGSCRCRRSSDRRGELVDRRLELRAFAIGIAGDRAADAFELGGEHRVAERLPADVECCRRCRSWRPSRSP